MAAATGRSAENWGVRLAHSITPFVLLKLSISALLQLVLTRSCWWCCLGDIMSRYCLRTNLRWCAATSEICMRSLNREDRTHTTLCCRGMEVSKRSANLLGSKHQLVLQSRCRRSIRSACAGKGLLRCYMFIVVSLPRDGWCANMPSGSLPSKCQSPPLAYVAGNPAAHGTCRLS